MPRHVALVEEADLGRGFCQRQAFGNQLARQGYTPLGDIGMRRQPRRARKSPYGLKPARTDQVGKIVERYGCRGRLVDHRPGTIDLRDQGCGAPRCRHHHVQQQRHRLRRRRRVRAVTRRQMMKQPLEPHSHIAPVENGVVEFEIAASAIEIIEEAAYHVGVEIEHAPPPTGITDRHAVMHLPGIDRDRHTGASFDHAAPARRFLRAGPDDADAELVMAMAWKAVRRLRLDSLRARHSAFEHTKGRGSHRFALMSHRLKNTRAALSSGPHENWPLTGRTASRDPRKEV